MVPVGLAEGVPGLAGLAWADGMVGVGAREAGAGEIKAGATEAGAREAGAREAELRPIVGEGDPLQPTNRAIAANKMAERGGTSRIMYVSFGSG